MVAKSFFNFCFPNFNPKLVPIIQNYSELKNISDFTIKHTIGNQYIFMDTDISALSIDTNYIIGHSHQQYCLPKNEFKIYNTGSLGQNRQYLNQSCYLQIDTEKNQVELKFFIHNISKVISEMKSRKYPEICLNYYLSKDQIQI